MFREFGRSLAESMFDTDEAESIELLREWRDQRWRPLFGSLQIDPALPINDLVCTPWPKSTEWAEKLSPLLEWTADWHHSEHRDVRDICCPCNSRHCSLARHVSVQSDADMNVALRGDCSACVVATRRLCSTSLGTSLTSR